MRSYVLCLSVQLLLLQLTHLASTLSVHGLFFIPDQITSPIPFALELFPFSKTFLHSGISRIRGQYESKQLFKEPNVAFEFVFSAV